MSDLTKPMTAADDFDAALRQELNNFCSDMCAQAAKTAILAAINLHQPFTKAGMVLRKECSPARDGFRYYVLMPWPCSTWKAIASAFGIEAPELEDVDV